MATEVALLMSLRKGLSDEEGQQFDLQFAELRKKPEIALVISLVGGFLGADRFYLGHTTLGVLKLVTLGGFVFWTIVDWFLIMGAARQRNVEIAREIRDGIVGMRA